MLVHNTQNHRVSGLCPLSGIPKTRKHNVSETGRFFPTLRLGEPDTYSVGSLRNIDVNSFPSPEGINKSSFRNIVFSSTQP
jgi:hypothetical protein